jgi:hypothetical protein
MGFEIPGFKVGTQVAAANLTANRFVTFNTAGKVAQVGTAGAKADGVVTDAVSADEATPVETHGVAMVEAGAAIANCGPVTSDNQGRAIATTTAGHHLNGIALETAAAAGEIIAVLVTYKGVVPAA